MIPNKLLTIVLVLAMSMGTIFAQQGRIITGKVQDSNGEPIPGASVFIKGTGIGLNADINGKYELHIPANAKLPEKPVIVFSFIGMKQEEVALREQKTINVVLQQDASLDEVVVTGYQTVSKRDMAGSFQQIKAEEILMPSYTSIDQMLQGRVAGMVVTQTSSRVGTSPDIKIRGTSTILGNTFTPVRPSVKVTTATTCHDRLPSLACCFCVSVGLCDMAICLPNLAFMPFIIVRNSRPWALVSFSWLLAM